MVPKGDLPLPAEIFPAIFLLWVLLCVFFFQAGAPVDGYTHSTEKRGGPRNGDTRGPFIIVSELLIVS
jgi:hypothetical protein